MQRNMALNTLVKNNGSNLNVCNHATPSETIGAIEKCNITIEWNNTNVSDIPVWKALDFSAALYHSTETSIIYGGVEIPNEDLPIFDLSDCKEVKAIDNYIYFEKGSVLQIYKR